MIIKFNTNFNYPGTETGSDVQADTLTPFPCVDFTQNGLCSYICTYGAWMCKKSHVTVLFVVTLCFNVFSV